MPKLDTLIKKRDEVEAKKKPIVLFFTTYQCVSKCLACYCMAGRNRPGFNEELFYSAIEDLKDFKFKAAGGEQTLDTRILDFYKVIGKKDIITSGINFPDVAHKLKDVGITKVRISLHGPDAETQNRYFNIKIFDRTIRALAMARQEFEVETETTLTLLNYQKIPKIVALAEQNGVSQANFLFFIPIGRGISNRQYLELDESQRREAIQTIIGLRDGRDIKLNFFGNCGPNFFGSHIVDYFAGRDEAIATSGGMYCSAGEKFFVLDTSGDVYPCTLMLDRKIGIYEKGRGLVINTSLLQNSYQKGGACVSCEYERLCQGGCQATRIAYPDKPCITSLLK
ncbi:radical SAM protein [Candidatus Woesearchaeota archaeon]|nr:radical SAM protein [Candidatus Woesearchaeota archaeon]